MDMDYVSVRSTLLLNQLHRLDQKYPYTPPLPQQLTQQQQMLKSSHLFPVFLKQQQKTGDK